MAFYVSTFEDENTPFADLYMNTNLRTALVELNDPVINDLFALNNDEIIVNNILYSFEESTNSDYIKTVEIDFDNFLQDPKFIYQFNE
jgi:hypothetical protein